MRTISLRLTSPHFASLRLTSPHFASPRFALCSEEAQRLDLFPSEVEKEKEEEKKAEEIKIKPEGEGEGEEPVSGSTVPRLVAGVDGELLTESEIVNRFNFCLGGKKNCARLGKFLRGEDPSEEEEVEGKEDGVAALALATPPPASVGDLQSILSNLGLPPGSGSAGGSLESTPTGASTGTGTAAAEAAAEAVDTAGGAVLETPTDRPITTPAGQGLTLGGLQAALAGATSAASASASASVGDASLTAVLSPPSASTGGDSDFVSVIMSDPAAVTSLLEMLPKEERTEAALEITLRGGNADGSYQSAIALLERAVQGSESFNSVVANLGLSGEVEVGRANEAVNRGESVRAFLEGMIRKFEEKGKEEEK